MAILYYRFSICGPLQHPKSGLQYRPQEIIDVGLIWIEFDDRHAAFQTEFHTGDSRYGLKRLRQRG